MSTRPATASVIRGAHAAHALDQAEEGRLDVVGAGASRDPGRGVVGEDRALAHQQQPVAALGLVHDVAGDEHRGAVVGEPVEQRPEVAAQHRVEPDGRLVEDEQLGAAEQRDREAGPGALAAAELRRRPRRRAAPRSTASIARSTSSAPTPSTRAK